MKSTKPTVAFLACLVVVSAAFQVAVSVKTQAASIGDAGASGENEGESSLQEWFMLNGFSINVTEDETGIETFQAGRYRVEILAELASYALNNSMGWYPTSSGELNMIFYGDNSTGDAAEFYADEQFGLCLNSPSGAFYTETSRNPDGFDHAWVFMNPQTVGYIVAWEDLAEGGDKDFQDMVLAMLTPVVDAAIKICPETLCLKSKGRWITCFIQLANNYDARNINVSTVTLNQTVHAEAFPIAIRDYDYDGVCELMVKFSREEAIKLVKASLNAETSHMRTAVTLTVTGSFYDGSLFEGSDIIETIHIND